MLRLAQLEQHFGAIALGPFLLHLVVKGALEAGRDAVPAWLRLLAEG